jgi:hypothetical protein
MSLPTSHIALGVSLYRSHSRSSTLEVVGKALLLRPHLLVVRQSMVHELLLVCVDELLAAVRALKCISLSILKE